MVHVSNLGCHCGLGLPNRAEGVDGEILGRTFVYYTFESW